MAKYTETDLQNALADIGGGMAVAKAAKLWSVPRTTLCSRIRGAEPKKVAMEHCQRLSSSQEEGLAHWIRIQGTIGSPPTHATIRFIASQILANDGDPRLGKTMDGRVPKEKCYSQDYEGQEHRIRETYECEY